MCISSAVYILVAGLNARLKDLSSRPCISRMCWFSLKLRKTTFWSIVWMVSVTFNHLVIPIFYSKVSFMLNLPVPVSFNPGRATLGPGLYFGCLQVEIRSALLYSITLAAILFALLQRTCWYFKEAIWLVCKLKEILYNVLCDKVRFSDRLTSKTEEFDLYFVSKQYNWSQNV